MSRSRVIGVLGTEATVRQPYVDDLAARFAADCNIVRHGSPELVELAEAKLAGEEIGVDAVRAAALPLFDAPGGERIDTVVVACTHFPLLEGELKAAFPGVSYVDGGPGIARRIAWLTRGQPWPSSPPQGTAVFTSAGTHRPLEASLARFGLSQILVL
jgi:glutamate racemase